RSPSATASAAAARACCASARTCRRATPPTQRAATRSAASARRSRRIRATARSRPATAVVTSGGIATLARATPARATSSTWRTACSSSGELEPLLARAVGRDELDDVVELVRLAAVEAQLAAVARAVGDLEPERPEHDAGRAAEAAAGDVAV